MRLFVLGSFVQACCWTVQRLPEPGETLEASSLNIEAGGKGLNVVIGSRRLGADVAIALGVGSDDAANAVLKRLYQEQVDTRHVHALAAQSGYGAGFIGQNGQNAIAVYPGPNLLLSAEHIARAAPDIANADAVYAQFETSLSAIGAAFEIARQNGVVTVLNPSPWQLIPADILQNTDILIVNEVEVLALLASDAIDFQSDFDSALQQLQKAIYDYFNQWQGRLIVVTFGCHGSAAFERDCTFEYSPAFPITAIDTVGAGDAFASGFVTAYLNGENMANALAYGNACGAMVASCLGVLEQLPDTQAVQRFLQAY